MNNKVIINKNKTDLAINIVFLLFSISYWISFFINGGEILTILSQYLFKFSFLWIAYHYLKDIAYNIPKREYVKNVFIYIMFVQIAVAIFKIFLMGFDFEGLVGTMSYGGGGPAVVIPIVAMIFYWLIKNGRFRKKDWIIITLILIIAIASGKRQPIIIYPAILFALFVFVSKSIRLHILTLMKYSLVAFLVFYFGVRMTSTMTPEKKIWGSFDISYISKYVSDYYFGNNEKKINIKNENYGSGRGTGFLLYFNPDMLTLYSKKELLFGKGVYEVAIAKYGRFTATSRSDYGIKHKGLIGEAGAIIYTLGYLGTIFIVLFAINIIFSIKNKRLAWLIFFYFLWDFLFYYNQMLFFNSSALIILSIIFCYNSHKNEKIKYFKTVFENNKKKQKSLIVS